MTKTMGIVEVAALAARAGRLLPRRFLEVPQRVYDELYKEQLLAIEREKTRKNFDKLRREQIGRGSLLPFIRYFWHVLEPKTRKFIEGWPIEAVAFHLEAITFGDINRLLINVPPGFMKSLLTDVFWPAWEWGPMNMPHMRYVAFSYSDGDRGDDSGRAFSHRRRGDRIVATRTATHAVLTHVADGHRAAGADGSGSQPALMPPGRAFVGRSWRG
jgi:hypothetical protein